jgi:hypothetical protein
MGRTFVRQDEQVRRSETYDDDIAAGQATLETASTCLQDDLNAARSQLRRWMWADGGNNYYDDVPTITSIGLGKKRGINDLAIHVDALEEHRILFRAQVLTDVVVPAGVKATSNLLLNSLPLNNETVTIGTTTYTFKTVLTPLNWEVLIGATKADSADNLTWAINKDILHAGVYQVPNAHPDATAAQGAGDSVDVTAIVAGTKGNLIAVSETLSDVLSVWNPANFLAGGAGDIVVLSVAGSEAPSEHGAIGAVTTKGAVAAYNSDFPNWKLVKVSHPSSAIQPKNLCIVRDASTGEVILSGDKEVYALLASEVVTDDQIFNDTTQQVELVFVKENMTGTDLEQVPGTDIGGKTINYSYVRRLDFDNLPETAFLTEVFLDQAGAVDVTRQHAYDNQGTTPVEMAEDAYLDIALTKLWDIRDALNADLFKITEGSGLGVTTLQVGAAVDTFDVNAIVNDFDKGVTVDSGGVDIQLGITAIANTATIGTLAGNDLRLDGAREMRLDDGNQTGSTWVVETDGIKLSDTTAEWDAFRTAFGEVSLLNAIVAAQGSAARAKQHANVILANIPANTLIKGDVVANISAVLPSYKGLDFEDDVDVYINGLLQRPGASALTNNDVYPSAVAAEQALGNFYCEYQLNFRGGTNPDVIIMTVYGTPTP